MEFMQFKYFRHAAKSENFSHTAKAFMVPPSSVSAAIKKLEASLGVKLFERTANTLRLSESGKIFLKALDEAETIIKKAKIDMQNLSVVPQGEIKLLILTNRNLVTNVIAEFKKTYPEVAFSIVHEDYGAFAQDGKFDVVVSDRQMDSRRYERREFVQEEIYLAVQNGSPLARQNSIGLKALAKEDFISMPKGYSIRACLDSLFEKNNATPEIAVACDDPHYICAYVKMGLGVALFPSVSWQNQMDGTLSLLRIGDGMYRNTYIYVNKQSSRLVQLFADTLGIAPQKAYTASQPFHK